MSLWFDGSDNAIRCSEYSLIKIIRGQWTAKQSSAIYLNERIVRVANVWHVWYIQCLLFFPFSKKKTTVKKWCGRAHNGFNIKVHWNCRQSLNMNEKINSESRTVQIELTTSAITMRSNKRSWRKRHLRQLHGLSACLGIQNQQQ